MSLLKWHGSSRAIRTLARNSLLVYGHLRERIWELPFGRYRRAWRWRPIIAQSGSCLGSSACALKSGKPQQKHLAALFRCEAILGVDDDCRSSCLMVSHLHCGAKYFLLPLLLQLDPTRSDAWANLGGIYVHLQKWDKGYSALEQVGYA